MKKEYIAHITRVVHHIEQNLASPFTIEELAGISGFSPYHFHRVFKRVMNENVFQFINRLRVEMVMKFIHHEPERNLTEIALVCGLQSPAHLSRTFRRFVGMSATKYRRQFSVDPTKAHFDSPLALVENEDVLVAEMEEKYCNLRVAIRKLPEKHAACIHRIGTIIHDVAEHVVEAEFGRLHTWMQSKHLMEEDSQAIGLIFDDPYITPESKQRYAVCFTTSNTFQPNMEVQSITLPGGMYAVFTLCELPHVLHQLIHIVSIRWLPLSPYLWDESRRMMAIFPNDPLGTPPGQVRVEFCIPVQLK